MKFGAHIYLWIDRWSDATVPLLPHARSLGLDWLEIAIGDDVQFTPHLTRQAAADAGLELVLSPGAHWPMECDLSLPDPALRQRALDWHTRALDLCAAVGAIAYTGAIYSHPGHVQKRLPTPDEYQRTAEGLHELAARAAGRHVSLCLEPMSHFRTHLVNRPDQLMDLIRLSDHPNLFGLLDTYHLVTEIRDFAAAVHTLGSRLWGLHACENDRGVPGGGLIPWPALFGALEKVGFAGYVGLESYRSGPGGMAPARGLFHDPCPDGDAFVRDGVRFLKGLFNRSRGGSR